MKKVLLVGMFPEEVREMLLAQKDLALVHDSNEFFENELFFETLKNYDAVILSEVSDFSFCILEEMAAQNKPILFRNAYENTEKNTKIKLLEQRARNMSLFFESLHFFDAAPLYAEIAKYIEVSVRKMIINKSFATSLSKKQLEAQIDEYLYAVDLALGREKRRTAHFFNDKQGICRVEGKVNFADYTLNVLRKDEDEEQISVHFGGNERLTVVDGELTFYPRQGAVKTSLVDANYLPAIEPLFNKFVQSIGQI